MSRYRISVHPAGMVMLAAACLIVPVGRLLPAVVAVVIHEAGHVITMRICAVERCHIEWTPVGFVAKTEGFYLLSPSRRFWIAAGGVLASGVGCLICLLFAANNRFAYELLTANLSLCLFNSLPALPLDGSKMLLALTAKVGLERKAEKLLLCSSYAVAAALCLLGVWSAAVGLLNPTLLLIGPYLAYAGKTSIRESMIGSIQRLEERRKRSEDRLYPVCSYAVVGRPDGAMLLRAVRRCPENAYLLICQMDEATGALVGISTENQIVQNIFQEHEMIAKPHRHTKSDVLQ